MKVGTEDKKKLMIAGVLGFFAIFAGWSLYATLFGGTTSPPPPPPVITTTSTIKSVTPKSAASAPVAAGGAQKVGSTAGQLDPTLHMEAMLRTESLVYSGTGRNIFAAGPAEDYTPVKTVQAKYDARPNPTAPGPREPAVIGPPPINLKFFGTATSANGTRRAFLLNGDDVWLASVGDVVQRRYRIVSIAATSIQVEDIPNANKQTLPLVPN
jgi:hypothetical protein